MHNREQEMYLFYILGFCQIYIIELKYTCISKILTPQMQDARITCFHSCIVPLVSELLIVLCCLTATNNFSLMESFFYKNLQTKWLSCMALKPINIRWSRTGSHTE